MSVLSSTAPRRAAASVAVSLALAGFAALALAQHDNPHALDPVAPSWRNHAEAGRDIAPAALRADITTLASDTYEGRMTGEPGGEKARAFIEARYKMLGLEPAGDAGGFSQWFDATIGVRLAGDNSLRVHTGSADSSFAVDDAFLPFAFSDTGTVDAGVVFAGYGITAPDHKYDDYAGLDVKDKIVLLLRHEPGERDSASVFNGAKASQYSDFRLKLMTARQHGAAGVLIVLDPLNHAGDDDDLVSLGSAEGFGGGDIPAVYMKQRIASWMAQAAGGDLRGWQRAIDSTMTPQSRVLDGVTVRMHVGLVKDRRHVANVVAVLPGSDPVLKDEFVAIGAHYDHLGRGGANSLARDNERHDIHHGADDNASGSAGVMALAASFTAAKKAGHGPKRSVIFLDFTGEEEGLLGSSWYTGHPTRPLAKTVAMINMDMIGRMKDDKLTVSGVGSSPEFHGLVDSMATGLDLKVSHGESGYGPSDHSSFYTQKIPVLFLFTGAHEDYHRPTDTADKINYDGEARILRFAARALEQIANQNAPVAFTRAKADSGTGSSEGAGSSGYGPAYMGSIPDFGEYEGGVKITGTREGSPAEKAGLLGGDVIVGFAGKPVKSLYDYTYVLRAQKPGDVVQVEILRGTERKTLTVTLGKRPKG